MAFVENSSGDGFTFSGAVSANTVGPYPILGGKYAFFATAPSTSATLNVLMPDGSTYQQIYQLTGAGYEVLDLPPGKYEIVLVATGAVQGGLTKIPYSPAM